MIKDSILLSEYYNYPLLNGIIYYVSHKGGKGYPPIFPSHPLSPGQKIVTYAKAHPLIKLIKAIS